MISPAPHNLNEHAFGVDDRQRISVPSTVLRAGQFNQALPDHSCRAPKLESLSWILIELPTADFGVNGEIDIIGGRLRLKTRPNSSG